MAKSWRAQPWKWTLDAGGPGLDPKTLAKSVSAAKSLEMFHRYNNVDLHLLSEQGFV